LIEKTTTYHKLTLWSAFTLVASSVAWAGQQEWPPARPLDWICPAGNCEHVADDPQKGLAWAVDFASASSRCASEGKPVLAFFSTRSHGVAEAPNY